MKFLYQISDIISSYDLTWYETRKKRFVAHEGYDKKSKKVGIKGIFFDSTNEEHSRIYYTTLNQFLYDSINDGEDFLSISTDKNIKNAIDKIVTIVEEPYLLLIAIEEKHKYIQGVLNYSIEQLNSNREKYENQEYSTAIDLFIKYLVSEFDKHFLDLQELNNFINSYWKFQPNRPHLTA
jgi:hypothetical protein